MCTASPQFWPCVNRLTLCWSAGCLLRACVCATLGRVGLRTGADCAHTASSQPRVSSPCDLCARCTVQCTQVDLLDAASLNFDHRLADPQDHVIAAGLRRGDALCTPRQKTNRFQCIITRPHRDVWKWTAVASGKLVLCLKSLVAQLCHRDLTISALRLHATPHARALREEEGGALCYYGCGEGRRGRAIHC